jgi:hypothetical protein
MVETVSAYMTTAREVWEARFWQKSHLRVLAHRVLLD